MINRYFSISFIGMLLCCSLYVKAQSGMTINTDNIAELIKVSEETFSDEVMIVHKGNTICHWINEECNKPIYNTASMVKSWTGLVIGIMIDKGLISSENDLVCQYLPEWKDGCANSVTMKDLLTMSAGINRRSGAEGILAEEDMNQFVLDLALDTFPNIRFNYSNESVQILGLVIESVSGQTAYEYFDKVLFKPLDMDSTHLGTDAVGNYIVYGGALTTVDDAMQIGLLMLNNGRYNGKQVVSSGWIEKSITPSKYASYYGYLWWIDNNSKFKNYAATGDFGQMTIVFPELELVYIRRQSCNKDISGNMTWMGPKFLELIISIIEIQ